ncbi:MAG: hypothetical protein JKY37_31870 [Nannocystaceae bacterium]|nr:hypothetical protein [Nannocystaceae bacterium]
MMVAPYIEQIRSLADGFGDSERNLRLYFPDLETAPPTDCLNRVFGPPIGLGPELWPTYAKLGELLAEADCVDDWDPRDTRMEHVFTVDLRGIRVIGAPRDARAMLLFISNAGYHRACGEGNAHTSVVFLSEQQVANGLYQGPLPRRSLQRWSRRFTMQPVDVPGDVFDVPRGVVGCDPKLIPLYAAIRQAPARLGGCPTWLRREGPGQAAEPSHAPRVGLPARKNFMMQFRSSFADVNLGRSGIMFVGGQGAYYQSR